MAQTKSTDPSDYMGVYKRLEDVPERRRLHQHSAAFEGRDVYGEYIDEVLFERIESERSQRDARCTERRWKEHMDERGRHHALATPDDVESWYKGLLNEMALETIYSRYFVQVEGFFSWLQSHADYPHVYHPLWMAAADPEAEATTTIWEFKINRTRGGS